MKLGDIIREYRLLNHMSMGDFARMSGISKPYVSMLEANKNSKSGKPIVPSVETLNKVTRVIGLSLDELLRKLGDEKVDVRPHAFNADEAELVDGYRALPDESKQLVKGMVYQLSRSQLAASGQPNVVQKNVRNSGANILNVGNSHFNQHVTVR